MILALKAALTAGSFMAILASCTFLAKAIVDLDDVPVKKTAAVFALATFCLYLGVWGMMVLGAVE